MSRTGWNTRSLLLLVLGFAVWGGAFILLYGVQATGCKLGWQDIHPLAGPSLLRLVLALLFLAFVALTAAIAWWSLVRRRAAGKGQGEDGFMETVGWWASLAALATTIVCFVGIFGLTMC